MKVFRHLLIADNICFSIPHCRNDPWNKFFVLALFFCTLAFLFQKK
jgi:hypothetical protein